MEPRSTTSARYAGEFAHVPRIYGPLPETTYDCLSVGMVVVAASGELAMINRKAEELLGVRRTDLLGVRVDQLSPRNPLRRLLFDAVAGRSVELSHDGLSFQVKTSELLDESGAYYGDITELHDITVQKKERIQREEFVAMMTHDLKSPLTVIMGYVQAVRYEMLGSVDGSVQACLEEIDRSSFKLLSMIEDMLVAYRLEVGLLQINRACCDIGGLLEECCADCAKEASTEGITFSHTIERGLPLLFVDEKQLVRVFANLIGNAIKFTRRNGRVHLSALCRDGKLHVAVEDTGIGIPEQDVPRIFTKYFRSGKATGFKGTGLGLTISQAIVEAHEGSILVTSREGRGSCFTVILPLADS